MLRSFLLAPCLLICLACATPFPTENLEEGMTMETVRKEFGAPEAIETGPDGTESSWTYVHEEKGLQEWVNTLVPLTYFSIPLNVAFGDSWDYGYVLRGSVVLDFEEEKLARWIVLTGPRRPESLSDDDLAFSNWMDHQMQDFLHHQQDHRKDIRHHEKKGHEHHHVDHDDC